MELWRRRLEALPSSARLAAWVVASAIVCVLLNRWLHATFELVGHPVSLNEANGEPSAAVQREWYGRLVQQGTLGLMIRTELIDTLWAASLACVVVGVNRLAAGLLRRWSPGVAAVALALAPLGALAPAIDVAENVCSLVMLTDPFGFPDGWAAAHAGLSRAKGIGIALSATVGPGLAVAGIALGFRDRRRRRGR